MALELKVKIDSEQEDCSYFTVVDDTGLYDAVTNTTGYANDLAEYATIINNPMRDMLHLGVFADRVLGTKKFKAAVTTDPVSATSSLPA